MKRVLAVLVLGHALSMFFGSLVLTQARTTTALAIASRIDPFAIEVHEKQLESLFQFYKERPDPRFLQEAHYLAGKFQKLYPVNGHVASIRAITASWNAVHGGGNPDAALALAYDAMEKDPIALHNIETAMFLLAYKRTGLAEFKRLGIRRAALTTAPLTMLCPVCKQHWMKHQARPRDAKRA